MTLIRDDLDLIPAAIQLSRQMMRIIRQNLFWAFCYNIVAIPVAAGAFYPLGLDPQPRPGRRRHGHELGERGDQFPAPAAFGNKSFGGGAKDRWPLPPPPNPHPQSLMPVGAQASSLCPPGKMPVHPFEGLAGKNCRVGFSPTISIHLHSFLKSYYDLAG